MEVTGEPHENADGIAAGAADESGEEGRPVVRRAVASGLNWCGCWRPSRLATWCW
jgi:hypothetical protein